MNFNFAPGPDEIAWTAAVRANTDRIITRVREIAPAAKLGSKEHKAAWMAARKEVDGG